MRFLAPIHLAFCLFVSIGHAQISWVQANGPFDKSQSYVQDVREIIADSSGILYVSSDDGISRSIDNGEEWKHNNNLIAYSFAVGPNHLVYAGFGPNIFGQDIMWTNGAPWQSGNKKIENIITLAVDKDNVLFAGTGKGAYRSLDSGFSWTKIYPGPTLVPVYTMCVNARGELLICADGLYRSYDKGDTWENITADSLGMGRLICTRTGKLLSVGGGIFESLDHGSTWSRIDPRLPNVSAHYITVNSKGHIFAGTNAGVLYSTNEGKDWSMINTGLTDSMNVSSIHCAPNDYVFVGTRNYGVFRSKESTSDVHRVAEAAPLSIQQNFPNPFSTVTTITYSLPHAAHTTITVHDILGKKVATLIDEPIEAGTYQAQFDGSHLPAGMYVCRLAADGMALMLRLLKETR